MKKNIFFATLLFVSCQATEHTIIVENPLSVTRVAEVVEVEVTDADSYAVFDAEGDAMQCQTTYDGKIVFEASVEPNASSRYTLRHAKRPALDTIAQGSIYPQWYDDYGWENDKIGFRAYSDKLIAAGNKLYGLDIFTKRYERPVLDILYGVAFDKVYQKCKNPDTEYAIYTATSLHIDHGLGMDYYTVGPTLGSGTAALVSDGDILYPGGYEMCEILDAGGLRATARLTYAPFEVNGEMIQELRTITLDKGTHFNHIEVEYKNLSRTTDVVVGIVLHDKGEEYMIGGDCIAYAEPRHEYEWQTYNAVIYPALKSGSIDYFDEPIGSAEGHLLAKGEYKPGEKLSYYMGAGWNRWGFKNAERWFNYVKQESEKINNPLICTLK